jgi:hypothetical protein
LKEFRKKIKLGKWTLPPKFETLDSSVKAQKHFHTQPENAYKSCKKKIKQLK